MDIQTLKVDLIHWLTEIQDQSLLEELKAFKEEKESTLSEAHKTLLDERIASYEENPEQLQDWSAVQQEIEKSL